MKPWSRASQLRESMWFVPGLMVVAALALAQGVIVVDLWFDSRTLDVLPDSFLIGVEGSRGILVAIGGSVLAVAATTFSITMSVIATASSTYGPRLVRNFMADRSNQRVLGLFVAHVRLLPDGAATRPGRHRRHHLRARTSRSTAPWSSPWPASPRWSTSCTTSPTSSRSPPSCAGCAVSWRVRWTASTAQGAATRVAALPLASVSALALADRSGFVTTIDAPGLVEAAKDVGVAEMLVGPGTHVLVGEPLARVIGDAGKMSEVVRRHVHVGGTRTPTQDVHFAVQQMVEMAVRAVSPSTNDPYTARNVVAELACGLVPAVRDDAPGAGWTDDTGTIRLVWQQPSGADLVDGVFDDLRVYAASDPAVVTAALQLAGRLLRVAGTETAARVQLQLDELLAAAARTDMADFDLDRLRDLRTQFAGGPDAGDVRGTGQDAS